MKHFKWVDWLKAIAIYSVVLLHTDCSLFVVEAINAYVMPLFFFASGFLFSYERNPKYALFLKKRFRQIMVPYLWINAITYLVWLLVVRHFGTSASHATPWHIPILGIFAGIPYYLSHNVPMWSLICFFVVEAIFYPLNALFKKNGLITASFALIITSICYYLLPQEIMVLIPFTFGPAIMSLFYYGVGFQMRKSALLEKSDTVAINLTSILISAIILYVVIIRNNLTGYYLFDFSNIWLYYIGALAGICLFVSLSRILGRFSEPSLIRSLSYGTLLICGFHLMIFSLIKGVALYILGIDPSQLTDGVLAGVLFSLLATLLCLPIVWAVKRWARWLVDK